MICAATFCTLSLASMDLLHLLLMHSSSLLRTRETTCPRLCFFSCFEEIGKAILELLIPLLLLLSSLSLCLFACLEVASKSTLCCRCQCMSLHASFGTLLLAGFDLTHSLVMLGTSFFCTRETTCPRLCFFSCFEVIGKAILELLIPLLLLFAGFDLTHSLVMLGTSLFCT